MKITRKFLVWDAISESATLAGRGAPLRAFFESPFPLSYRVLLFFVNTSFCDHKRVDL